MLVKSVYPACAEVCGFELFKEDGLWYVIANRNIKWQFRQLKSQAGESILPVGDNYSKKTTFEFDSRWCRARETLSNIELHKDDLNHLTITITKTGETLKNMFKLKKGVYRKYKGQLVKISSDPDYSNLVDGQPGVTITKRGGSNNDFSGAPEPEPVKIGDLARTPKQRIAYRKHLSLLQKSPSRFSGNPRRRLIERFIRESIRCQES